VRDIIEKPVKRDQKLEKDSTMKLTLELIKVA